ncbi:MAG TPA: hypothetical protein VGI29_03840 [Candidatus Binataceae bacterium]|jgi:hypothetical protein
MDDQKWRDVWDETRAALMALEDSAQVVSKLEREALVTLHASTLSEGITKTLEMMKGTLEEVRTQTHAADSQLGAAVDALTFDILLRKNASP